MKKTLLPLIALFLAACGLLPQQAPTPTTPPTATFAVTARPTLTPPPPTPTLVTVSPACIPAVKDLPLDVPAYAEYPDAILDYLNDTGSPVALSGLLNAAGVAAQPVSVAINDFTGDGRDDVAVALIDPQAMDLDGRLLVYACALAGYERVLDLHSGSGFPLGFHIWFWQDLNADGGAELLASQAVCGAHTCFDDLMAYSWDGASFVNLLEASTVDLPYPAVQVRDPDGDGLYTIEISSGGFGSVGAGPQRPITYIYRTDRQGGTWKLAEQRADPSPYRIHVLHDADDAVTRGEFDLAVQLYRRVIDDPGLDNWVAEDGGAALAAYARYRLAAIAAALQDAPGTEAALAELQTAYPVSDPLHDFVEMAILFKNAFASGGLGAACTAAAGFAESHASVILQPLGSAVYGYANRDYTGESMCPAPDVQ